MPATKTAAKKKAAPDACKDEKKQILDLVEDIRDIDVLLDGPDPLPKRVIQRLKAKRRELQARRPQLDSQLAKCELRNPPARGGARKVAATRKAA